MDKTRSIILNAVVIAFCAGLAYVVYLVFDAAVHGVIEEIRHSGIHGLSVGDKIWLLELLASYLFLGMLTTHHFFQVVVTIKAIFDQKEVKESHLWDQAYGFFILVLGSMALLIING